jgi:hypothetical protein
MRFPFGPDMNRGARGGVCDRERAGGDGQEGIPSLNRGTKGGERERDVDGERTLATLQGLGRDTGNCKGCPLRSIMPSVN